jgi:TonB family protein
MAPLPLAILVYSVQVLVVVVVATAGAQLFRLTHPSARLAYWRGIGVLCLALPLMATFHAEAPAASVVFGEAAVVGAGRPVSSSSFAAAGSIVVWIYGAGVAARVAWLLLGALRLRRIRARSTPAAVSADLDDVRMAVAPRAEFRWTRDVAQPVACGLRRPVVLLPREFDGLGADAQRSVACHELLHVARRDWLWIVIEEHLRAVFWFHPAAWWVLEQVQLSREQVIDQLVVARTVSKRAYMRALLAFSDARHPASPAMAFVRRRHLKIRLQQLSKESHMSVRRLAWTMAALAALVMTTATATARALPLDVPSLRMQAGAGTSLELRLAERAPAAGLIEAPGPDGVRIYLHPTPLATAADVTSARVVDGGNLQYSVAIGFSDAASVRMVSATQAHIGRPVAILLDREVIAAPTLRSPIGEAAVISGLFTEAEAQRIAAGLTRDTPAASRPTGVAQSIQPRTAAPIAGAAQRAQVPANVSPVSAPRPAASANSQAADLKMPEVVVKVDPRYTQAAMDAKIEGDVLLSVVVEEDGSVSDVTVTQSLDSVYGLDDQAVNAARQWTFNPATKNGTPVAVAVTLQMRFTLK